MTNNPNPQQNKPTSPTSSNPAGRQDANPAHGQDAGRGQGSGEKAQFGGIRGGVEQSYGAEKSSRSGSQDIERCLDAIEENCRKLRDSLSASSTDRSESTDSSRQTSSNPSNKQDSNPGRTSR